MLFILFQICHKNNNMAWLCQRDNSYSSAIGNYNILNYTLLIMLVLHVCTNFYYVFTYQIYDLFRTKVDLWNIISQLIFKFFFSFWKLYETKIITKLVKRVSKKILRKYHKLRKDVTETKKFAQNRRFAYEMPKSMSKTAKIVSTSVRRTN